MKEYEDIFGAQIDNVSNDEVENNNALEENGIPKVEIEEINSIENVNSSLDSVFPNYSENVEPIILVEDVNAEETEEVVGSADVNNVFGENVVETIEEVANPIITDYNESVEPVMPVEEISLQEPNKTMENNYNPMEHPDAKIVLNKNIDEEETKEVDPEIKNMKVIDELKSNKSLMFVLILGVLLLVVIFAIPYVSELLG